MNPEDRLKWQVTSLEISKKMAELGFLQENLWHWVTYSSEQGGDEKYFLISDAVYDSDKDDYILVCSAYTVAELGEILPTEITIDKTIFYFETTRLGLGWSVQYTLQGKSKKYKTFGHADKTEANARGKMTIYLKEEGIK